MSGLLRSAACLLALGLTVGLSAPAAAAAAVLKRSLGCAAIHLVLTTPLGGTTNSSSVAMKNNGTSVISAGTVYTYTIPAGTFERRNPSALGPGEVFSVPDARITDSGTCSAWVPRIINRLNAVPIDKITLAPN